MHPGAQAFTDWRKMLAQTDAAVIVISATNDILAEVTLAAIRAGRHVLVEKPAARTLDELLPVIQAAHNADVRVRVGFNHRFHPALSQARRMCSEGAVGELMFLRGRYGHGGRLGYEKEWRANPGVSGGGELLDQGVHMIDLARWFLGDFVDVSGFAHTYFWNMPVDDNAFLLLRTASAQAAWLHVSCTEWKNMFSFEIYGRTGKLQVDGLGGSYGSERLTYYKMLPEMGPPATETWEHPGPDHSWAAEFAEFLDDIRLGRTPAAGLTDAQAALAIVKEIYQGSIYDHHA